LTSRRSARGFTFMGSLLLADGGLWDLRGNRFFVVILPAAFEGSLGVMRAAGGFSSSGLALAGRQCHGELHLDGTRLRCHIAASYACEFWRKVSRCRNVDEGAEALRLRTGGAAVRQTG